MKKILTLDDLVSFYKSNKFQSFSAKDSGYQLCVHALSDYDLSKDDGEDEDELTLYGRIRAFHLGLNRNKSYVSKESALKAMKKLGNKPVLAHINNFAEDDEEEDYDFASHEIEIDDDGNIVYIEQQVGNFTSDPATLEYDEDMDKYYVVARVAIPRTYTKAADIIEKKNGTKVSVELLINSLSWNTEINALSLDDFEVQGITLLGRHIDNWSYGSQVEEGMEGARLDLEDFKEDNNSIVKFSVNENDKLIETLEKLNSTLSNLSINNISRKEENLMDNEKDFEEVVEDTVENTTENTENVENFENESVVVSEDTEDSTTKTVEEDSAQSDDASTEEPSDDNTPAEFSDNEEENKNEETVEDGENVVVNEAEEVKESDNTDNENNEENKPVDDNFEATVEETKKITFELSHEDLRCVLYDLLNATYPDEWYFINAVYDDYIIIEDWNSFNSYFKQGYTKTDNAVELVGDKIEVFAEYLTAAERDALDLMRNTYENVRNELNAYKAKEAMQEKFDKVVNNKDYSVIKDSEEFKNLVNDADKYTVDEFCVKADLLLAKYAKSVSTFAVKKEATSTLKFLNLFSGEQKESKKNKPYGGIFEDYFNNKTDN